jgi:hypothetical protein
MGEIAALHPLRSGPDLDAWSGRGAWRGKADYARLEVRTTTRWQLFGFAKAGKDGLGLGGWRVAHKDLGRYMVCVEDRGDDLLVMGWIAADSVPRLSEPFGSIIAVIEPPDLQPLFALGAYRVSYGG